MASKRIATSGERIRTITLTSGAVAMDIAQGDGAPNLKSQRGF
jgi:hypothetical protein